MKQTSGAQAKSSGGQEEGFRSEGFRSEMIPDGGSLDDHSLLITRRPNSPAAAEGSDSLLPATAVT
jgi:hypothetical protein